MRVVSTTCSNTEILCALKCESFLVGVDRHSDYPEEVVNSVPRVGKDLSIDVDAVVNLKPDLVLASLTVPGHEKVVEELQSAGLNVFAPEPVSLRDVYRDIKDIGALLHCQDRATKLVEQMNQQMPRRNLVGARPKLLVEWWPKPCIVPGKMSWVSDIIKLAGGVNPLAEEEVKSRPISDEEAAKINPAAIIMSWCGVEEKNYRDSEVYKRGWDSVEAIERKLVVPISEAFLGRPGPRLVQGYQELVKVVNACVEIN